MRDTIDMAREAGWEMDDSLVLEPEVIWYISQGQLERFEALIRADERERICKAIKEEDDYCVTEGDYMLDSDDCIAVTKGAWVRPEFNLEPIRARGQG